MGICAHIGEEAWVQLTFPVNQSCSVGLKSGLGPLVPVKGDLNASTYGHFEQLWLPA